jgi:hypothetical protein
VRFLAKVRDTPTALPMAEVSDTNRARFLAKLEAGSLFGCRGGLLADDMGLGKVVGCGTVQTWGSGR